MAGTMSTSRWILDEMGTLHGAATWSDETFDRMNTCLAQFSDGRHDLQKLLENGWNGMLEYGVNPPAEDPWFKAPDTQPPFYREYNPTPLSSDNVTFPGAADILIYEPCNYASNIAYHRTMIEICERDLVPGLEWTLPKDDVRGFVEAFNVLGMGSAFFHASATSLGYEIDNRPIDFFALLFVQSTLSSIPFNPILHEIRLPTDEPRQYTAAGFIDRMSEMVAEQSVYEWEETLQAFNAPDYYLTFGAYVGIALDVLFLEQPDKTDNLITLLGSLLLSPEQVLFLTEDFLPEFRREVSSKTAFGGQDRATFSNHFMGALMKMVYAFYWQENIIDGTHLDDVEKIQVGAEMLPVFNALANSVTGFTHVDAEFQQSLNVYPGDAKCRAEQPHSIWHEQSGNGLVDLALVANYADQIIRNPTEDGMTIDAGLLYCLADNDCLDQITNPDGTTSIDTGKIINCVQPIPIINPRPPCQDKMNLGGILACIPSCPVSETSCQVNCILDNTQLGVTVVPRK